ncbi:hypothetical protein VC83_05424 [Pseudogymnoascus destructans]|uniref:Uncharacterized protein n=1 Tax=Pseudogymnoascus destructans TaxID=655981 RepID=A0A177A9F4_9PEZI|nr:uncharacterized protein VC83_05424 [Pseudogymnoascus destructans]OAF58052.1 hypothetical protein VC83_05424 [Pseudogymnoascus destructans]
MMDLLGSYYLTGNETEQARNLFDDLQMGEKGHASETFPEFKARFQSAAIIGQVSESEWFQYMWNKLTPQFRSCVAIIKNQWNGDYQTMQRCASKPTRATPALFTQTMFGRSREACRLFWGKWWLPWAGFLPSLSLPDCAGGRKKGGGGGGEVEGDVFGAQYGAEEDGA